MYFMKKLIIYHKADFDGIFSREIARKFYGDTAEYLGWDYGDAVPIVEAEREVVMIDISVDGLMDHRPLVWIDHHKSAIAKFSVTIPGYRIDGVAACRLAWQYFFTYNNVRNPLAEPDKTLPMKEDFIERRVQEPMAVRLAGEYDIWDKRDPNTDIFQSGLRSIDLSNHWAQLLSLTTKPTIRKIEAMLDIGHVIDVQPDGTVYPPIVYSLLANGRVLKFAKDEANASLAREVTFALKWEGLKFLALNKPRANSLTFTAGLTPEYDACLSFYWMRNKWRVSLYGSPHHPEHDLSLIAVKYGGGGHKQACGFESKTLPFTLA